MFASAAREAVFSNPDVIRRINADFVPVALKAGLVNNPPNDDEGRLYREIGRSKVAPQGICVANSVGKVLDWALMFDDDQSVLDFLDHCRQRFAKYPDAKQALDAERYMKFPGAKLDDIADTNTLLPVLDRHPQGKHCPGTPPVPPGTVIARLFGRALDKDGKPVADTVRQEHYVEDRFNVPVAMQQALAKALAEAGPNRFRLADDLARLLVSHAYLGQLDMNPVVASGRNEKRPLQHFEFWAQKAEAGGNGSVRLRVEGKSEAAGGTIDASRGDGALWQHEVKLTWDGIIEMKEDRMPRILLVARGSEILKWENNGLDLIQGRGDVARLPSGHAIDLNCGVRYGIIGEPAAADQVSDDAPATPVVGPVGPVPEDALRQLEQAFGPAFLISRNKVQEDLKLSAEQREKLQDRLAVTVQEAQQFFQKLEGLAPENRDKELAVYRERTQEKLSAFLQGALNREQLKRFGQLGQQQQGFFALLQPNVAADLKVTAEQQRQFMAVLQNMETQMRSLIREAQNKGNPAELGPQVMQVRREHERKLEAVLNDSQKQRWQELLGKPLDLTD